MENQEIMTNNEVVEAAEEIVEVGSGSGLKLVGGALIIAGLAYGGYRLIKKLKAKKDQTDVIDMVDSTENECDVVDETNI